MAWRTFTRQHRPVMPGQLVLTSGLFAALALLAEYPPAVPLATMLAFGVDLGAILQIIPGTKLAAEGTPKTGTAPKA